MSMFSSLNLQFAWLNAGVDAVIEWQWDGDHAPSEIFGNSLSLYVDQMVCEHVVNAVEVTKEAVAAFSFFLADAAAYRTRGASKAIPSFDVIDYGQEDYVFGSAETDARHWNRFLLEILEEHEDVLERLFNAQN